MEDYGTTPSANGIIEHAVKLPCNHIMGSECISTWVSNAAHGGGGNNDSSSSNNNTCPMCRQVLFEVQSPPISASQAEHRRIHIALVNRCVGICAQLDFFPNPHVAHMARYIANEIHDRVRFEESGFEAPNFGDWCAHAVAAASVYMASHLMGDARSLEMVSSCVVVGVDAVRRAYNLLYFHRYRIISQELLDRVGFSFDRIDRVLPPVLP